jgi:hypothetical protein
MHHYFTCVLSISPSHRQPTHHDNHHRSPSDLDVHVPHRKKLLSLANFAARNGTRWINSKKIPVFQTKFIKWYYFMFLDRNWPHLTKTTNHKLSRSLWQLRPTWQDDVMGYDIDNNGYSLYVGSTARIMIVFFPTSSLLRWEHMIAHFALQPYLPHNYGIKWHCGSYNLFCICT